VDSGFINRLVGTSIVVVAAIIFIPNILDGEKVHYKEGFKAIPERPEFTTVDLQSAIDQKVEMAPEVKGEPIEDITSDDHQFVEAQTNDGATADVDEASLNVSTNVASQEEPVELSAKNDNPTELKRSPSSNLAEMAYVIQLGSFSHKPNVDALVEKLKKSGFEVFTRPVKTPNGTLTKVFVGPDLSKEKLEAKLPELKKLTKLNGRLTQFNIAN
jgi:DedD protein